MSGKVVDAGDGTPLAGAQVTAGDFRATTDAQGRYALSVPPDTYAVKITKFGYAAKTLAEATFTDGQSVTDDAALTAKARVAVSGTVKDDSGHDWPLYASVSVKGEPTSAVHTDPVTGRYTIQLPENDTYTLQVDASYPGYRRVTEDVTVAGSGLTRNVGVKVDEAGCSAAGYGYTYHGAKQDFEGSDGTTPPEGWTVVDDAGEGQAWRFDSTRFGNHTGGTGKFAMIDSDVYGPAGRQDTSLVSPVWDFSDRTHPILEFGNDYHSYTNGSADVDLSTDGGTTWQTLSHWTSTSHTGPVTETLDLSAAAGKSQVQVRFRYTARFAYWWAVDDVFAGDRTCDPKASGLVVGQVTDRNTESGVAGASVTSDDKPADGTVSVTTPDDTALGDGFYWFVSSLTGTHPLTAHGAGYAPKKSQTAIGADAATAADFALAAGRLQITASSIDKTVAWKGSKTATATVKNTGTADATVKLTERTGRFDMQKTGSGAPTQIIKGSYSPGFIRPGSAQSKANAQAQPYAAPWTTITDYKLPIMDNAVATGDDGTVYSVGGTSGNAIASNTYVYDPATTAWSLTTDSGQRRDAAQTAFLNGMLYVTGGWSEGGDTLSRTQAYDPQTDSWSNMADVPKGYAGAASATLDGMWYVVGGCGTNSCGARDVHAYNPDTDDWKTLAPYPEPTSWLGCGGINGQLYCAGGTTDNGSSRRAYVYDPTTDAWSPIADLPLDLWGGGYTAVGGQLLMSGGTTGQNTTVTNQGVAYDPRTDAWSDVANSNNALYRGGSSCGFYKVGGSAGGFSPTHLVEQLPGLGTCNDATEVDWLSLDTKELTLAPGESKTATVTVDAGAASVSQPGVYRATLAIAENTPYAYQPIGVTMTVNPPATWGKITGTVKGADCSADPAALKGATVRIKSASGSYTLKTDRDGMYALWLDARNSPLEVIAVKDGWTPDSRNVRIKRGDTTTADFTLQLDHSCS
ncbi:carboxypeptidase regulatory-like domain-containing protein [Streptomyces sp. NPDC055400]